jgi:hypothetical protein
MEPSHPSSSTTILDKIERVLTSPADFTSTTPADAIGPLLAQLSACEEDGDDDGRITRVEHWCRHLGDATRAAEARELIRSFLREVEAWDAWRWDLDLVVVDAKRRRIDEITRTLASLPIEWLKGRVTGNSILVMIIDCIDLSAAQNYARWKVNSCRLHT